MMLVVAAIGSAAGGSSGADVELTTNECALLRAFVEAPKRMLSREHLLQVTRTHGANVTRSLDMQVYRLRRKLPGIIQIRRGEGYVFAVPVERV